MIKQSTCIQNGHLKIMRAYPKQAHLKEQMPQMTNIGLLKN